ncbi:MAG: glutamate racemase [Peptococcaceae bacterium]|jgi:glutamate racemase|nr:glutamate racemase [Peptococcaceae bacterium]
MTIGFFDSGVGGLTVLAEALRQLPEENYIYYADTEHVPYGIRNKDEVRRFVLQAVDFMAAQNIKALVVACNTATSIAINNLRQKYDFPVLGMEPAVKPAVEKNGTQKGLKRVLVAATQLTLREQKYQDLVSRVDQDHIVDGIALPELVEYAENFVFDPEIIVPYLKRKLTGWNVSQYGTVVLGCTHFRYFERSFAKVFPADTDIIDGSIGTIRYLKTILEQKNLATSRGKGEVTFYSSGKETAKAKYQKYLDFLNTLNKA